VARQHGAVVHDICISPWRFDLARNAALALVPRDFDICVSLDIDEMLQPGWREEMERVWLLGKTTRLRYRYEWSPGVRFYYEKIHARHGYRWHHPCHEYPVPDGRIQEDWAHSDMLMVVHGADPHKSRGFYLDLLELSVKEDPHCPRNAFYYARELSFNHRWRESITECKRYLALPAATWDHERAYAYRVIGKCHASMGEVQEAEKAFHHAALEAPHTREGWCELAMLMHQQGRWNECFAYSTRALSIKDRPQVYTIDPAAWGALPHDLASISGWALGLREQALQYAKEALSLCPDDTRIRGNVDFMEAQVATAALPAMGDTPNVVHFLYFGGRPFSYVNYLAVRAAYEVQQPDVIYMHCTQEPVDNPNWEAIRPYVKLRPLDDITHFEGKEIPWPQYKSDIARIRILLQEGGIYFDNDMVLVKKIDGLLGRSTVMSYESKTGHALSNAFIATPANSPFLKIWLERMASRINGVWADHSVVLSAELAHKFPNLVRTLPCATFCPFYWDDQSVFHKPVSEFNMEETYAIHLWDSLWSDNVLSQVNEEYLRSSGSAFAAIFRKYALPQAEAA
jgi:tetratricopeptide (TPR) repeat protein